MEVYNLSKLTISNFQKYCSKYNMVFLYDSCSQKGNNTDITLNHVERYFEVASVLSPNILAFKNNNGYISFSCVRYILYNKADDNEYDSIDIVCGALEGEQIHTIVIEKRIPKACY